MNSNSFTVTCIALDYFHFKYNTSNSKGEHACTFNIEEKAHTGNSTQTIHPPRKPSIFVKLYAWAKWNRL